MPNLAATLKMEIRRLARKEIRDQTTATRRAAVSIARTSPSSSGKSARSKEIANLQTKASQPGKEPVEDDQVPPGTRFSPRSVKARASG